MAFKQIILIGLAALLASCKHQQPETTEENFNEEQPVYVGDRNSSKEEQGDNKTHFEAFNGRWMTENYLKGIEKDKSIYQHRNYSTLFYGFDLRKENLASNDPVIYGFTDHEGGFEVPVKWNKANNAFTGNDGVRNLEMKTTGEKLELYFPQSKKTETYRKIRTDIATALREAVITGTYHTSDNHTIQLSANGTVRGFEDYAYYELIFDFTEGIYYDAVVFFKNPKGGNWSEGELYQYRINENNLLLTPVITDWDNLEHQVGDEVILLVKTAD